MPTAFPSADRRILDKSDSEKAAAWSDVFDAIETASPGWFMAEPIASGRDRAIEFIKQASADRQEVERLQGQMIELAKDGAEERMRLGIEIKRLRQVAEECEGKIREIVDCWAIFESGTQSRSLLAISDRLAAVQPAESQTETQEIKNDPETMAALKRSDEDVAAGRVVPFEEVKRQLGIMPSAERLTAVQPEYPVADFIAPISMERRNSKSVPRAAGETLADALEAAYIEAESKGVVFISTLRPILARHLAGLELPPAVPAVPVSSWEPAAAICEDVALRTSINPRTLLREAAAEIRKLPVAGGKRSEQRWGIVRDGKFVCFKGMACNDPSALITLSWDDPAAPEPAKEPFDVKAARTRLGDEYERGSIQGMAEVCQEAFAEIERLRLNTP